MGRLLGSAGDNLAIPRRRLIVMDMKERVCTASASGPVALPWRGSLRPRRYGSLPLSESGSYRGP
jgi:hypothetical protein